MSDILYIGDIPSDFHYAIFNDNHIDLYNVSTLHNNTYVYYRIYTNYNNFMYEKRQQTVNQYTTTYTNNIQVSNNKVYRNDFDSIVICTFIFVLVGVWFLNLLSSAIRKGGLLGGLF